MKKAKIFIGPAGSGKTRTKAEIVQKNFAPHTVLQFSLQAVLTDKFVDRIWNAIIYQTRIIVIEDLISNENIETLYESISQLDDVQFLIIFSENITAKDFPAGASFTERFDVIQFPLSNEQKDELIKSFKAKQL